MLGRRRRRLWTTFTNKGYDAVWTRGQHRHPGPPAPPVVRRRQPRRRPPGGRPRLEHGSAHRDRAAQAHHPAELLPLRLGPGRQPDRAGQRRAPGWSSPPTGSRSTGRRAERAKGQAWGLQTISTFHTHGTPPVAGASAMSTPVRIAVLGLGEAGRRSRATWSPPAPTSAATTRRASRSTASTPRAARPTRSRDADLVLSVNSSHDAMTALENALPALAAGHPLGRPQHRQPGAEGRAGAAAGGPERRRWSTSR